MQAHRVGPVGPEHPAEAESADVVVERPHIDHPVGRKEEDEEEDDG